MTITIDGKEYAIVPVRATEKMIEDGQEAYSSDEDCDIWRSEACYKAMLSAAPPVSLPQNDMEAARYWISELRMHLEVAVTIGMDKFIALGLVHSAGKFLEQTLPKPPERN